jgi:hypothetical protein
MLNLDVDVTATVSKPVRLCLIFYSGTTLRIAEGNAPVTIGANTFFPLRGFTLSAIKHSVGGAPPSLQITAAMSVGGPIDTYKVVDGFFDDAVVVIYVADRAVPSTAALDTPLFAGRMGAVSFGALHDTVTFDVRGDQTRQYPFAQTYGPMCRTDLGSDLCRVPLRPAPVARGTAYVTSAFAQSVNSYAVRVSSGGSGTPASWGNVYFECTTAGTTHASVQPSYDYTIGNTTTDGTAVFTARNAWTRSAIVDEVFNNFNFSLTASPDVRAVTGWFNQGAVRMYDGYSAGRVFEVGAWHASTLLVTTYLPLGAAGNGGALVASGDLLEIWPGCDFTVFKCANTYNNSINFRGEPYFAGAAAASQQN